MSPEGSCDDRGMTVERNWRSVFEETYAVPPSRVAERVWRPCLAASLEAEPDFRLGFVSSMGRMHALPPQCVN